MFHLDIMYVTHVMADQTTTTQRFRRETLTICCNKLLMIGSLTASMIVMVGTLLPIRLRKSAANNVAVQVPPEGMIGAVSS